MYDSGLRYKTCADCGVERIASFFTKFSFTCRFCAKNKLNAKTREHFKRNPHLKKRYYNSYFVNSRARGLLQRCKYRAKKKGFAFELTEEWMLERFPFCELSDLEFDVSHTVGPLSPSIDRIDSSKGYLFGNSRLICWSLNAAFMQWGDAAFEPVAKAWLAKLANSLDESDTRRVISPTLPRLTL